MDFNTYNGLPVQRITLSNGCDVAYIDTGRGETTLLFIHGLASYALSWRHNIEHLQQFYRCIAVDLPGNGFSGGGDLPYSIDFFSGCIYDLIQKLGLDNVVLVGHSMGGQIAVHLLLNEPAASKKLVLCAPAGFETFTPFERSMYQSAIQTLDFFSSEEHSLRHTVYASFHSYRPEAEKMINELVKLMKEYPAKEYRRMVERCIHSMLHEPVFDRLQSLTLPVLVMFGEQDALIPNKLLHHTSTKEIAEKGTKQIPGAQLKMLPQCGHFLQIEKAVQVNRYIHNFIEGRLT